MRLSIHYSKNVEWFKDLYLLDVLLLMLSLERGHSLEGGHSLTAGTTSCMQHLFTFSE